MLLFNKSKNIINLTFQLNYKIYINFKDILLNMMINLQSFLRKKLHFYLKLNQFNGIKEKDGIYLEWKLPYMDKVFFLTMGYFLVLTR